MTGRHVENNARPRDFLDAFHHAPETAVKVLGRTWSAPLLVGPLAARARPEDELAVLRAAAAAGLPVVVSAATGREFTEPAAADVPVWLNIAAVRDRGTARELVRRAEEAGFDGLSLSLSPAPEDGPEPAADWSTVVWLASQTPLPLLVAGVDTAADVRRAIEAGAAGIVTRDLEMLPEIAAAVAGSCPVLFEGGVRAGADVVAALASGADAVVLGQPVLDGLEAGRQAGVTEVLDGLVRELGQAMESAGAGSVADLGPEVIRIGRAPAEPAPAAAAPVLRRADLHGAVSDPVLDTMNFLNEITYRYPDAISFAPGRPYDGFFDTEQVFTHTRHYLDHLSEQGSSPQQIRTALYQYGPTAGTIREIIADSLRVDEGIDVPAESLVVTVGAQEAMLLVLRALITGPDDVLLVSSPCYVGIVGAARLLDIAVHPVQEREDGLSCADVEAAILEQRARGKRPRALYVLPDHANPSGNTLDLRARTDLLRIAARHGVLILEDSPYRMVSPGLRLPTLKSLDRSRSVVHLGSFSKTVFPGARVGFVVADQPVETGAGGRGLLAAELAKIKSMVTVNTPSLSQAVVAGALLAAKGRVSEMNSEAAAYYGEAMRAVLRRLDICLPAARREALGVRWNKPTGGFFLSVRVPFRADAAALKRAAQEFGVIWTPMENFHPMGGGRNGIRLSISYLTSAEIQEGIARLARFIEAESSESER
jgi:(S)-3,5-dihydroxyphenylglycine transaminase